MTIKTSPSGTRLTRRGRKSVRGQAYHVVSATRDREPLLQDLGAARLLIRTLKRQHDANHVVTLAFAVMPDHLHWLILLNSERTLQNVMNAAKSESSRRINRHLRRSGPVWQRGYWDRAIRRDIDLVAVARYVVAIPVREGFVKSLEEYPHWDSYWL